MFDYFSPVLHKNFGLNRFTSKVLSNGDFLTLSDHQSLRCRRPKHTFCRWSLTQLSGDSLISAELALKSGFHQRSLLISSALRNGKRTPTCRIKIVNGVLLPSSERCFLRNFLGVLFWLESKASKNRLRDRTVRVGSIQSRRSNFGPQL